MPRVRANDYDDKKGTILDVSASLFAEKGFTGTKMEDIAEKCGVSKSMLYHYFKKKEDVLAEMLRAHILRMIEAVEEFVENLNGKSGYEIIRAFVEVYLEPSKTARAGHVVALHDVRYLTDAQRKIQEGFERNLIDLISRVLQKANPNLDRLHYRAYCLLLIGMMNWTELWYHRSGPIQQEEFYERISGLFFNGYATASL